MDLASDRISRRRFLGQAALGGAAALTAASWSRVVGAGEKLSEVFLGPFFGGGIENWFAYVLALLFLLVRPQGLFGERIIERV